MEGHSLLTRLHPIPLKYIVGILEFLDVDMVDSLATRCRKVVVEEASC